MNPNCDCEHHYLCRLGKRNIMVCSRVELKNYISTLTIISDKLSNLRIYDYFYKVDPVVLYLRRMVTVYNDYSTLKRLLNRQLMRIIVFLRKLEHLQYPNLNSAVYSRSDADLWDYLRRRGVQQVKIHVYEFKSILFILHSKLLNPAMRIYVRPHTSTIHQFLPTLFTNLPDLPHYCIIYLVLSDPWFISEMIVDMLSLI